MKGMMGFLERAGLVTRDTPLQPTAPVAVAAAPAAPRSAAGTPPADMAASLVPQELTDIYANAGVPASGFPAERLLRLVDGLSAMDDTTRLMAIRAMDAADDAWSIDDPLADAAAKVQALAQHVQQLQTNLGALEQDTATRLQGVAARHDQVVGDIRKQITELEALAARESARAAQETATHEAQLQAAREQTARTIAGIQQTSQRLQSLGTQFANPSSVPSTAQVPHHG